MSNDVPETVYVSFSAEINQQTTEVLLGVCAEQINKGVQHVYLALSTPGGDVMNGLNLYNMLSAMPCKLTTHNVGNVDSIGNAVFLAGEERYATSTSRFLFHGVGFNITEKMRFEEKLLRERLESLKNDQERIGAIIAERTNLSGDEVASLFFETVTKDPDYAKANGIIHEIRELRLPPGATLIQLVFQR